MVNILGVNDPGRGAQLEGILEELILKIMKNLVHRGYDPAEILTALDNVSGDLMKAYNEDLDPAEDPK